MCTSICYFDERFCSCCSLHSEVLKILIIISFYLFFILIINNEGANDIVISVYYELITKKLSQIQSQVSQIWMKSHIFNLPITMWMRWVWLWHISKCKSHSSKLGMQYSPPACGRRATLHPQFLRIRFAFTNAPSPDSSHSSSAVRLRCNTMT